MRRVRGFTLIELLVVVGIISVIVAMLLPALNKARRQAEIIACGGQLHAAFIALTMYANDYREYPFTKPRPINDGSPLLLQGAHAGFLGVAGGNPDHDIRRILVDGKYTTEAGLQCTLRSLGTGLWSYSGNNALPFYGYSGPNLISGVYFDYGHKNGLEFRSDFEHDNTPLGQPYRRTRKFRGTSVKDKGQRALMVCPSILPADSSLALEPHDKHPPCTPPHALAGSHQQGSGWICRRRNYLFSDGAVEFIRRDAYVLQ
jgi:prepilin-type N-terminal cleavage/methylation domain-containing protein